MGTHADSDRVPVLADDSWLFKEPSDSPAASWIREDDPWRSEIAEAKKISVTVTEQDRETFRGLLEMLDEPPPPIDPRDAVFEPTYHLALLLAHRHHPRGRPLMLMFFSRCHITALRILAEEGPRALRNWPPPFSPSAYNPWQTEIGKLIDWVDAPDFPDGPERARGLNIAHLRDFLGRQWSRFAPYRAEVLAAWKAAIAYRRARDGTKPLDLRGKDAIADFSGLTYAQHPDRLVPCLFVGDDGRLKLGPRQARDMLAGQLLGAEEALSLDRRSPEGTALAESVAAPAQAGPEDDLEQRVRRLAALEKLGSLERLSAREQEMLRLSLTLGLDEDQWGSREHHRRLVENGFEISQPGLLKMWDRVTAKFRSAS